MKNKKTKKIVELVTYCTFGALAVWGFVYIVLGLLADNLPLPVASNPLKSADEVIRSNFGLGFFGWGLILFGVFGVVLALAFVYFAKDIDKDYERNQRRAARLKRNVVSDTKEEVVDVKVE